MRYMIFCLICALGFVYLLQHANSSRITGFH